MLPELPALESLGFESSARSRANFGDASNEVAFGDFNMGSSDYMPVVKAGVVVAIAYFAWKKIKSKSRSKPKLKLKTKKK